MLNRISHISLFLLPLVILLSTSCSQINKAPIDSLNIGSFGNDQKLVEALSKSFQSQNKTKINLLVIHPKQAEEFLKKNKIDLYIGTIDKYSSDIFEQQLIAKSEAHAKDLTDKQLTSALGQQNKWADSHWTGPSKKTRLSFT